MARKKKYHKQKPQKAAEKQVDKAPKKPLLSPQMEGWLLTGVFAVISFIGILYHEMWRDEYQAWLIARDAHSFSQLFENLKYEGHPPLLYLFLYGITAVTNNPFAFQVFSWLVGVGLVFTVTRYAPFSLLQKVLFILGYFVLYEYTIIARAYGLGLLFLFLVAVFWKKRKQRLLLIAVFLALMANTSIFGLILALTVAGIIIWDSLKEKNTALFKSKQFAGFALVLVIGFAVSVLIMQPEEDNSYPVQYTTDLMLGDHWSYNISRMFDAYFAVPDVSQLNYWNTNFFTKDTPTKFNLLALLVFAVSLAGFMRRRSMALLFAGGTLGLLLFHYVFNLTYARYLGHFLLFYAFCYWLAKQSPLSAMAKKKAWTTTAEKLLTITFVAVLAINAVGGVLAWKKDLVETFSASQQASKFLKEEGIAEKPIVAASDYLVSPLAGILNRKLYYPEHGKMCSYVPWNTNRKKELLFPDMAAAVEQLYNKHGEAYLIITQQPEYFDGTQYIGVEKGPISETLQMEMVGKFPPQVIEDEEYYIYKIMDTEEQDEE